MLKRYALITLLFTTLFSFSVFAQEEIQIVETCRINASLELTGPTQIFCDEDLHITDGVEILTHGHGLQIVAIGRVQYGTGGAGMQITSLSGPSGQIFIFARTASGNLVVQNQGQPADSFGGNVEIEYGSSYNYSQLIEPGHAAEVHMVVAGEQLQLEGAEHRLPL